jgi:hypothetical protein
MVLGAGGGETIAFGIKAIADLRGVDQTAKALTGLGRAGNQLGQGVAQSSKQASAGLLSMQTRADSAAHSLRGIAAASAGILGVGVALFKSVKDSTKPSTQSVLELGRPVRHSMTLVTMRALSSGKCRPTFRPWRRRSPN